MHSYNLKYMGVMATSQEDGTITWINSLSNINSVDSNYIYSPSFDPPVSIELANSYLYFATCYYSSGSPSGYEIYLLKINPSTGAIAD